MVRRTTVIERLQGDGWIVDEAALEALDTDRVISSPKELAALLSPLRLRLLSQLSRHPSSAKELAESFDMPTTRLYHHLSVLEDQGAIGVVASRRSGARTERCYGAVRGGVSLSPDLIGGHAGKVADAVSKVASLAGEAFATAVRVNRVRLGDGSNDAFFSFFVSRLTEEQKAGFNDELADLTRRIGEASEANEETGDGTVVDAEATLFLFLASPDVTFLPSASTTEPDPPSGDESGTD